MFILNLIEYYNLDAEEKSKNELSQEGSWIFSETVEKTVQNVDAAIVLTEWNEYMHLNWNELSENCISCTKTQYDQK